ncbi:hypothetical protein [Actinocorallia sp. A-T 12471]|uniref:hypothetical protein n=1 Tax=Actinocorallia sp. A-T 12471 TaxID=3089813 RepID=UPI0029D0AF7A|nr:hypothetical protein [Actinocorallia sp. A-T 12471]MDX6738199.1 hypothetical protein [Actinocorallia sp. A-T 12471]
MQCPECRSETPGSLGRCTRCDAQLPQADEAPWTPRFSGEPWPPEPWQPDPAVRSSWRPPEPVEEERAPWPDPVTPSPSPAEQRAEAPEEPPPWQADDTPWAEQPDPGWGGAGRPEAWGGSPQPPGQAGDDPPRVWGRAPQAPPRTPQSSDDSARRYQGGDWLPDEGPRWRGPLAAGLVAALLTAAIVVGYVFWTRDSGADTDLQLNGGQGTEQAAPPSPGDGVDAGDEAGGPSGDAAAQAEAVDGLLGEMKGSRSKLANITYSCANTESEISTFSTVVGEREAQLASVGKLDTAALPEGAELKEALQAALQASVDANSAALEFLEDDGPCDGVDPADRLKAVNDKATEAKEAFLALWNPVAEDQGLPERETGEI